MKSPRWIVLIGVLTSCSPVPLRPAAEPDAPAALRAEIDQVALSAVERVPLDALSIVVLRRDAVLVARGYGEAAVTADTVYRIGSISKLVTALAIAQTVERGMLRLDDRLDAVFPRALPDPSVTIRQMLNHTSGLASHERAAVMRWREKALPITDAFVWEHLAAAPRLGVPGADWHYSSGNFHLLGRVLEQVTRQPYASYVQREIATPLDLPSLRECSGQPAVVGQRPDYVASEGKLELDADWALPGIGAAGGLCASARDLARMVHAVARGGLVSEETLAEMTSPTPAALGGRIDYGLGIRLGHTDGARKWGHTGGGAASNRAVVAHYPEHELTIAVLTNTERSSTPVTPMDIEMAVARRVLGVSKPSATLASDADLSRYVGTYTGQGRTVVVERSADGLQQRGTDTTQPSFPLTPLGGHAFRPYPEYPDYLAEFQMEAGTAVALAFYDSGWFSGLRHRLLPTLREEQ